MGLVKANSPIKTQVDILIIGGGLAGLTGAIDLRRQGYEVLVIEKKDFPRHKVCGEYVSNEIKPYLQSLDAFPRNLNPKEISRLEISSSSGKKVESSMKMGGFGISRFAFDHFLYEKGKSLGVNFYLDTMVTDVKFDRDVFTVRLNTDQTIVARLVIGAFGKRSLLDKNLARSFFKKRTDYIAVKHHFKADFPDDLVALHNFEGGYCGLSKVENDLVNLCFLTTAGIFRKYKSITELEEKHLSKNPHLYRFFRDTASQFEPLVISQVNFEPKPVVENHILMTGDAAGLIYPLCGNGMAMAIHSAKIAAEAIHSFEKGEINRSTMEFFYRQQWNRQFAHRLNFGRRAQSLMGNSFASEMAIGLGKLFPATLTQLARLSHGKYVY